MSSRHGQNCAERYLPDKCEHQAAPGQGTDRWRKPVGPPEPAEGMAQHMKLLWGELRHLQVAGWTTPRPYLCQRKL